MKVNTSTDPAVRTGDKEEETTIDASLSKIVRVSDDGDSMRFTDYFGKSIRVKLPRIKPIERGTNRDVTMMSYRSNTCPCCGCIYEHWQGMTVLIDPSTHQLCSHH